MLGIDGTLAWPVPSLDVSLQRQAEERVQREVEEKKRKRGRELLRQEIQEEEKKLGQLEEWIEGWNRADRLRRFIAVCEEESRSSPAEQQS